ncbi:MAG TPA: RagB/SusD family nutrient uptake outer membrane protein, partial [Mucilaginibacter sp.]|nr:RagB/SusD family nutrient uptake outer membrane protein [Mucilaginibacter sp.]
LLPFGGSNAFQTNTLNSSTGDLYNLWGESFFDIYTANAAIENLPNSTGVDAATKKQLVGEAKFLRALCYFYLVNWFGAPYSQNPNGLSVPLVTTNAYAINDTLSRATTAQVYKLIVSDLTDAQQMLAADYSVSGGERTRVNKAGATALLARVYLYMANYAGAEIQASAVISNSSFSLQNDLNIVFLPKSTEAILQWEVPTNKYPWATQEANNILPSDQQSPPYYFLTNSLISSFETGDLRWTDWVDTTTFAGQKYYYPYKYKVRQGSAGNVTENYVILRLAEQYLIRAEAEAYGAGNGLSGSITDLNIIRSRAGLPPVSNSLSKDQVLSAIAHERRIELFSEWGHRWLDLKRTGQAQTTLSANKGISVQANQLLYPIPSDELIKDNHLVQNPGY